MIYRMYQPRAICRRYAYPGARYRTEFYVQSLAEHSFLLAQLAPVVYAEFRDLFAKTDISPFTLAFYGIKHDNPEAICGDVSTDVDGVTAATKQAVEHGAISQIYDGLAISDFMKEIFHHYEDRSEYLTKIIKMLDALELVLYSQLCVRGGVGAIKQIYGSDPVQFCLVVDGEERPIDMRTYGEVAEYFDGNGQVRIDGAVVKSDLSYVLPISRIMYDHSLTRMKASIIGRTAPELIAIFELICSEAFKFPFEDYNLGNMPAPFAL